MPDGSTALSRQHQAGPVVVGGVGGSGTRVVAEMLQLLGYDIGCCLNRALDNLWFTLLLKRPGWLHRNPPPEEVLETLEVFILATRRGMGEASERQKALVRQAMTEHAGHPTTMGVDPREGDRLLAHRPAQPPNTRWGWKEPNSQLYVDVLARRFDDLRYVHVVRHGLDMAFSGNDQQVRNWGDRFGLQLDDPACATPAEKLEYWIRSNRRALDQAHRLLTSQFIVIDFDRLWRDPEPSVDLLLGGLGLSPEPELRHHLCTLPQRPASAGRWRERGLSDFSQRQIEAVRALGYPVDC